MTDHRQQLEQLAEAQKRATPGPWLWDEPDNWHGLSARVCTEKYEPIAQVQKSGWGRGVGNRNAALITAARNLDAAALLAAWDEREREMEALRAEVEAHREGRRRMGDAFSMDELHEAIEYWDAAIDAARKENADDSE